MRTARWPIESTTDRLPPAITRAAEFYPNIRDSLRRDIPARGIRSVERDIRCDNVDELVIARRARHGVVFHRVLADRARIVVAGATCAGRITSTCIELGEDWSRSIDHVIHHP